MSFSKILVANRGEIACRVIRTARRLGYGTVAVFSEADAHAPHVEMADEAVALGGWAAADNYLRADLIISAAHRTGAQAVHPGYGFLSENAAFAQACVDAGLVFIGPPPQAIAIMGDKASAKRRMLQAGVPCAPGTLGEQQDDAVLKAEALKLGFPLLVKALAGGGGRGMRLVRAADELDTALRGARREALSAFGDDRLMLERLIEHGRHIEIQVFADAHGQVLHLGERDCTPQRRRQKVIEEAPSPAVSPAMREAMGRDAVAAARAVGYQGAGTVEFIVDSTMTHYFLEMNTRLQVEHPVTECITGLDLVEWQIRLAAGQPLPLRQDEIRFEGHAIEARLYAEDPGAQFAPQTGTVQHWRPKQALLLNEGVGQPSPSRDFRGGIRIDAGIREGSEITPHYDPLLAKVIAHGRDRDDAIRRLRAALAAAPLIGLRHNARFLVDLLGHADFRAARMSTTTLDDWQARADPLLQTPAPDAALWAVAAAAMVLRDGPGWRADSVAAYDLPLRCGAEQRSLRVRADRQGRVAVQATGAMPPLQTVDLFRWDRDSARLRVALDGIERGHVAVWVGDALHLADGAAVHVFTEVSAVPEHSTRRDASRARSPVAGKVTHVAVAVGQAVAAGQALVCVEAMKMEMWLTAEAAGTVAALHVQPGEAVALDTLLVELSLSTDTNTNANPVTQAGKPALPNSQGRGPG